MYYIKLSWNVINFVANFFFPICSDDLLFRCVPSKLTVLGDKLAVLFEFLNKSDTFQKALSDLYASWKEMILLCLLALGRNIFFIVRSMSFKHIIFVTSPFHVCPLDINIHSCSHLAVLHAFSLFSITINIFINFKLKLNIK